MRTTHAMPRLRFRLLGVDFSSAPSRRKPIVVAEGERHGELLALDGLAPLATLGEFEHLLRRPGPWLGGFDLPFGLPREFCESLALGGSAADVVREVHRRCHGERMAFRAMVDAWGNARPPGQRLVHRATDAAAVPATTSPLQTRYVPVGFMYFEGFARIVAAGVSVPGLVPGPVRGARARVALEAYPGRAARRLIGARSYKNGDDAPRRAARAAIVRALRRGEGGFGVKLSASRAAVEQMIEDAAGDHLDAALCLMIAAWAERQPRRGLPRRVDALEGWVVGP